MVEKIKEKLYDKFMFAFIVVAIVAVFVWNFIDSDERHP